MIRGRDLLDWGVPQYKDFSGLLVYANELMKDYPESDVKAKVLERWQASPEFAIANLPKLPLRARYEKEFGLFIEAEADQTAPTGLKQMELEDELENIENVRDHMFELMRVPTVVAGCVQPDACPSDSRLGYIPVGGVIATENAIHPGMHSADICCSMALSVLDCDGKYIEIIDNAMSLVHFGPGGRPRGKQIHPSDEIMKRIVANRFLSSYTSMAIEHFSSSGDGNHFASFGQHSVSGKTTIVTHHGSRGLGAALYKAGMGVAEKWRRRISPETQNFNAWIPFDTDDGRDYWEALQIIREWTKASHYAIHDMIASSCNLQVSDRHWNEHNFCWQKSDGLFYHGKGATPMWDNYANDAVATRIIPLNMSQPILLVESVDNKHALEFAPHGAGRNLSRTSYLSRNAHKTYEDLIKEQLAPCKERDYAIDARFFSGIPDPSELPGAYKDADSVRRQINKFGLAKEVAHIKPRATIMCGDWQRDAPWMVKKRAKKEAARLAAQSQENAS